MAVLSMAQRWSANEWLHASLVLNLRQRGRCGRCGKALNNDGARHHRQRRRDGGDTLANLVFLHSACHRWVHANPVESRALGLIVSFADDPAGCPMRVPGRGWVLLDDEGRAVPCDSEGVVGSLGSGAGPR